MSGRTLAVWWDARQVGRLRQDIHGDLDFTYHPDWLMRDDARAISRSLPLGPDSFTRRQCLPFFGGLLPEADQRAAVAQQLGVSEANDFALLDRLGGDIAGALTLLPDGERPAVASEIERGEPLTEEAFAALLDTLPRRPMLAGENGVRMSLAGAQAKLPVVLIDDRPALPRPGEATTHIVKPENSRFPGAVANEVWCMALARRVGLSTATAEPRVAAGRPYLLVTRYDREGGSTTVTRLHQEDACQALGIIAERKYASEGGPAFRDLFELTRRYVRAPARDVMTLVDAAIFNLAIGNADAHGKNFSFLLDDAGPRLAPLYDLLATIAWPELSPRQAMRIGGRAGTIDELDAAAWTRFAADAGITLPFLRRRGRATVDAIADACAAGPGSDGIGQRTALRALAIGQTLARAA